MRNHLIKMLAIVLVLVMVPVSIITASSYGAKQAFTDVGKDHWAYTYVQRLQAEGIVKGYGTGELRPDNSVTYAEFIKMTVCALTGKDEGNSKEGHWASLYYQAAIILGLFTETQIPESKLDLAIPRYDMALIAANAAGVSVVEHYDKVAENLSDVDTKTTNEYKIVQVYAAGIITGYPDGSFGPARVLTRAESIVVICRIKYPETRVVPELFGATLHFEGEMEPAKVNIYNKDVIGGIYVKTADYIKNVDEYPDLTGMARYWTEDAVLYNKEDIKWKYSKNWEQGTQLSIDMPDRFPEPYMSVDISDFCFGAVVVKDGYIIGECDYSPNWAFPDMPIHLYITNHPSTWDYLVCMDPKVSDGSSDIVRIYPNPFI